MKRKIRMNRGLCLVPALVPAFSPAAETIAVTVDTQQESESTKLRSPEPEAIPAPLQ